MHYYNRQDLARKNRAFFNFEFRASRSDVYRVPEIGT